MKKEPSAWAVYTRWFKEFGSTDTQWELAATFHPDGGYPCRERAVRFVTAEQFPAGWVKIVPYRRKK